MMVILWRLSYGNICGELVNLYMVNDGEIHGKYCGWKKS